MPRRTLDIDVFSAALDRIEGLYRAGHRVVVSMSGGKDSTVCLEMAILAAGNAGRLPVEVVVRDEEIMFPGTYEYLERVAARPEVDMNWLLAEQPVINIFDRNCPYFWVFDPTMDPDDWVRKPPPYAYKIDDLCIQAMTTQERFPPAEGKLLVSITGLRTQESPNRRMSIHNTKGFLTKHPTKQGKAFVARPIYDWKDHDVWKAIKDLQWDYNDAYNVMVRMGVPRPKMRIGPPTMSPAALGLLTMASKAWPQWFDKVCKRLPGVRTGAKFGRRAVTPQRRLGETWEQCYHRVCIDDAPDWIAQRAVIFRDNLLALHYRHSTTPWPEIKSCLPCGQVNNWRQATKVMYNGDPFLAQATSCSALGYVEPEFFREGAGTWGGTPSF